MIALSGPTFRHLTTLSILISIAWFWTASALSGTKAGPEAFFPDSSIVDFSFLLDPPAGNHGFLGVSANGQFRWSDGKRARFWGVNISNQSAFADAATVDRVVPTLARAGVNMVRFEALDSDGGLLEDSAGRPLRSPDPTKLARLDYWTWRLRQRGIYYYFDLLDLRTFRETDGVPDAALLGRAARPYAMFDPQLIALQKEYAEGLLLHRNPHTGLRYVDDPALALVEICNESGFFLRPSALERMPPRVGALLQDRWNAWLLARYGSRERLAAAWTLRDASEPILDETEDPARGSVRTPVLCGGGTVAGDARLSEARYRDGARFLVEVQEAYFREMRAYLRSIGLKVPLTGVTSHQFLGDTVASLPLDFTAGNYYCDHPAFQTGDWQGALHFSDANPLREIGTNRSAPTVAALRWGRRPVVIREWAQPWPNRYRCVAPVEMVAYGSLQDADGFLLFGYHVAPRPDVLGDFDHQADPPVWGLMGPAALTYLRGDIRPSPTSIALRYSAADVLRAPDTVGDVLKLAWHVRVRSVFEDWPGAESWKPSWHATMQPEEGMSSLRSQKLPAGSWDGSVAVSSTREIVRRTDRGVLIVRTPRTAVISGEIGGSTWTAGPLRLFTRSPVGTVWAVSLDGLPLSSSRRLLVKMVTNATNTDQRVTTAGVGAPAPYRLVSSGRAPVMTSGSITPGGVRLALNDRLILAFDLVGGTWELLVDGNRASLLCDTNSATGTVFGHRVTVTAGRVITVPLAKDRHVSSPNRKTGNDRR